MAELILPQLGETVTEGTVTRWFKQVGDQVAADEMLLEISTDKVDTELPSPVAGVITEIRVKEGETVPVGAVLAIVGDAGSAPAPAPATEPEPVAAPVVEAAPAPQPAPAPAPQAAPAPQPAPAPTPVAQSAPVASPTTSPTTSPTAIATQGMVLSPVVRRLISDNNLDVSQVAGTGPGGRITRDDVMSVIDHGVRVPQSTPAPSPVPSAPAPAQPARAPQVQATPKVVAGERDQIVPLSRIRKATGAHMVMSHAVSAHVLSVVEVDFANVDKVRRHAKDEFKATEGFSLTYLPFIARAVIDAITDFPHLNASMGENELIVHRYVNLNVSVDLDYEGLIAPVVRDADTKRLRGIAREINDLATRARDNRLMPGEIQGGTFTLTNNGSAGSVLTMATINQPQVAILSTDAVRKRPVIIESATGDDSIAIHPVGNLAMSWDHRAFDGAYAANFLVRVKDILETRDWSSEL
jgi:pyruvate dehydrogenase E2 component (dihydrolipoamide acetyltransferase)